MMAHVGELGAATIRFERVYDASVGDVWALWTTRQGLEAWFAPEGGILKTAREWQDTLQSLLPGYAERIVEVRLDPALEGGLNLSMDEATIRRLTELGREAGIALTTRFDFDEHRWRRAISLLPELEDTLRGFAETLDQAPAGSPAGAFTYADILTRYEPKSYDNSQTWRDEVLGPFAAAVAAVGAAAQARRDEAIGRTVAGGNVPAVDSHIRLVADTDRAPQRPED